MVKRKQRPIFYRTSYPWSVWLKASRITLVRGRDFQVAPYCMAQQLRNKCTKRGVKVVHISVAEDRIEAILGGRK